MNQWFYVWINMVVTVTIVCYFGKKMYNWGKLEEDKIK